MSENMLCYNPSFKKNSSARKHK